MEASGGPRELKEGGEQWSSRGADFGVKIPGASEGLWDWIAPSLLADSVDARIASALPVMLVLPEYVFSDSGDEADKSFDDSGVWREEDEFLCKFCAVCPTCMLGSDSYTSCKPKLCVSSLSWSSLGRWKVASSLRSASEEKRKEASASPSAKASSKSARFSGGSNIWPQRVAVQHDSRDSTRARRPSVLALHRRRDT